MVKKNLKHPMDQPVSEIESFLKSLDRPITNEEIVKLASVIDQKNKDPIQLYPINSSYEDITKNLGGINILFGATYTGRKSAVYYGNRFSQHPIIEIDANIFATQNQFIQKLVTQFSFAVGIQNFGKKLVIGDQITFFNLTKMIHNQRTKVIIIIENAQKLVEPKRQTILYNILEWVKDQQTKQFIALYFITKSTRFTEDLQKRVKSRMTAKNYFFHNPDIEKIIKIIKCKITASEVNYTLKEIIIECLAYPATVKKMKEFFQVGKSIAFFLNWVKCTMCGLEITKLEKTPNEHFYEQMVKTQEWMSPNIGMKLLLNSTFPEIVFIFTVAHLLRQQCTNLNLDEVLKQHTKNKHDHMYSQSTGSSFNYSDIVLERAFQKLLDMKILYVDDSLETFRFAPITLALNREEMIRELTRLEHLPEYIKRLAKQA